MKKIVVMIVLLPLLSLAHETWIDPSTGIQWQYALQGDGSVSVVSTENYDSPAVSRITTGDLIIPSIINGKSVTSIGWYAFRGCNMLTSVTIPEGVTSIGLGAFYGCGELKSVTMPEGVTSIGSHAFRGCSGLTSVTIPSSVTSIGGCAFYDCGGLTSVTIPESVTSIGEAAFAHCYGLTSVTIPLGVTSVGDKTFLGCGRLTSVTIPEGVTSIGDWAFRDCIGLKSVTIPSNVTSIGGYAFQNCYGLTSVTIPEGVTNIGEAAFDYCHGLTSVTIPSSVAIIWESAFARCYGLTSVVIPSRVLFIGEYAFDACCALSKVYVDRGDVDRVKGLLQNSGYDVSTLEFVEVVIPIETIVPGEKVTIDTGLDGGYKAVGLPTGLKYDAKTGKITGAATKPTAAEGVVVKFTKSGAETVELTIIVTAIPTLKVAMEGDVDGCKVTGAGAYLVGKKVTLKATAPKGVVFMGWFDDEGVVATQTTYTFTMGKEDVALVAKFEKEVIDVNCVALVEGAMFPAGVAGAQGGIKITAEAPSGVKSVAVSKLPSGMKFDAKNGNVITGTPTKPGVYTVQVKVTSNTGAVETKDVKIVVATMPETAVGKFDGFVSVGEDNFGTFTLTTTDAGKLTAKVVTAVGTVSFSGTCWDSVEDGVYRAMLTTKKGETLTLTLDSTAAWDANQLSGEFTTAAIAETKKTAAVPSRTYAVSAQRNAFGKTWYFSATGDETTGWKLAYTEDTKGAALTVALKADGSTSIAGKLPNGTDTNGKAVTIKVSASGYANVGGLNDGAILADFAPVVTVNRVKKALAIKTNLWFDRKSDHESGVGEAKFVE